MALIIPVLVRGINNLSDARYCAGMGADGLIFTLDPSLPGAVDVATVKELAGWVAGVELIGEFEASMPVSEINRLVEECGLTKLFIRLTDGHWSGPLTVPVLVEVLQAAIVDGEHHADTIREVTSLFPSGAALVANTPVSDSQTYAYWHQCAQQFPLWLGGTITPDNVRNLVDTIRPAGLILQGGDEIKTGLRDFTELEAVFEALEEE